MPVFALPQEVEDALWQAARAVLPAAALSDLSTAVIERSRRYTSERERLGERPGGPVAAADLAARALFFTVADAPKVMVPLAELAGRGLLPDRAPLRIADLGAGVGAMSLGAAAWLRRPVSIHAVDSDVDALELFEEAVAELPASWPPIELRTEPRDLASLRLEPGAYDLVLAGTVLNELTEHDARALVREAIAAVGEDGAVILVEPALRDTSRALHALRDQVIEQELAHVFAPCIRTGAPCPSLADERDWCHEDRPTELPRRAATLAGATGLRGHGLKFSYVTLRHGPEALVEPGPGQALRVVSHVRKLKGKIECIGCGDDGWRALRLLRRHRSLANRGFERARRGEVVRVPGGDDLGRDDRVERIDPTAR
jgi:SAM-dependent methyltransferase